MPTQELIFMPLLKFNMIGNLEGRRGWQDSAMFILHSSTSVILLTRDLFGQVFRGSEWGVTLHAVIVYNTDAAVQGPGMAG